MAIVPDSAGVYGMYVVIKTIIYCSGEGFYYYVALFNFP